MRLPAAEEVRRAIAASVQWFRAYAKLAAFGDLCLGEASGVQVDDVVWLERKLRVRPRNEPVAGTMFASRRHGAASDGQSRSPTSSCRHSRRSSLVAESGVPGDEQWLVVGSGGKPPHGNTVFYHWSKTIAAASVEPSKLHDLRHF